MLSVILDWYDPKVLSMATEDDVSSVTPLILKISSAETV